MIVVGKPTETRSFGMCWSRWEDNIKMELISNTVLVCGVD
jgi:hypothetical protein